MIRIGIGVILIIAGIAVGIYVGFGLFFSAGVSQIIDEIRSPEGMNAANVAWGIMKIFSGIMAGWLPAVAIIMSGYALLRAGVKHTNRVKNRND